MSGRQHRRPRHGDRLHRGPIARSCSSRALSRRAIYERDGTFSPDGQTFYFTKRTIWPCFSAICVSRFRRGRWAEPEVAPFSGQYPDATPFISADGSRLYSTAAVTSTRSASTSWTPSESNLGVSALVGWGRGRWCRSKRATDPTPGLSNCRPCTCALAAPVARRIAPLRRRHHRPSERHIEIARRPTARALSDCRRSPR